MDYSVELLFFFWLSVLAPKYDRYYFQATGQLRKQQSNRTVFGNCQHDRIASYEAVRAIYLYLQLIVDVQLTTLSDEMQPGHELKI